jgi:hypothetical protein
LFPEDPFPSPKLQEYPVTSPLVRLPKDTLRGTSPEVGVAEKSATGAGGGGGGATPAKQVRIAETRSALDEDPSFNPAISKDAPKVL